MSLKSKHLFLLFFSASSRWKLWPQCDIRVQLCLGRLQRQNLWICLWSMRQMQRYIQDACARLQVLPQRERPKSLHLNVQQRNRNLPEMRTSLKCLWSTSLPIQLLSKHIFLIYYCEIDIKNTLYYYCSCHSSLSVFYIQQRKLMIEIAKCNSTCG